MYALVQREISSFFSSVTGYLVITVFLMMTGLLLWFFPGGYNVFDGGLASMGAFFELAPWILLFLAPAVCMRLIAEEKKSGAIELLLARPFSDFQLVFAKFLSGYLVVFLALVPSFVFFISIFEMGNPVGNIDMGATWGSYLGLFLLASLYVSIGVFASAITDNQVVAFIVGALLCFVFYLGFESIASLPIGNLQTIVSGLGISEHYESVSRGVIDLRDIVYFLSADFLFIYTSSHFIRSK